MPRGYFITFEGLDGSGKTTQLRRLANTLEAEGRTVVTLRQPGGTALGDRIRAILLDSRSEATLGPIAPAAEMALMFADRAQAIAEIILPALDASQIVSDEDKNGAVLVKGEPKGQKMGWMKLSRGHQGLLPKNTAYQFRTAGDPGVIVLQTCKGDLSIEKWADICQTH